MPERRSWLIQRRTLPVAFLAAPGLAFLDARFLKAQEKGQAARTPACGGEDERIPGSEEEPFYRLRSPTRHQLAEAGREGERITIAGSVLDPSCRPVADAPVQVWHADANGRYDDGSLFRGAQRSDAAGRWWFSTIKPAPYPGRTRHYHFKVQGPGAAVLTTQLYLPGEPRNARDALFYERLLLRTTQTADGAFGRFDFVV